MKKLITTMLAAVMISSCVVTPAFAYPSDIPSVGQQEYADNGTTKINAFNTDARVYPTSQAPELKNTKTINGVTFSEYIKHSENDITLENGEKVHLVRVWIGMDGCMHSSASDARFILHSKGITAPARFNTMDTTYTTGERCNYAVGEKFRDLEFWLVKPFADKKGTGGEYVGNLTWQFLKDEDKWAIVEEDMLYSDTPSTYADDFDVTAIVNGVKTNFAIVMTNSGTPKGDNTIGEGTAPITPAPGNTNTGLEEEKTTQSAAVTFSDVKSGDWFYQPVMELAGKGLVGGTTKPVNGVGTYEPNKAMTRAEFATIIAGYLFPEEIKAYDGPYNSYWYSGIYGVAVDMGLIKTSEFSEAAMNEGTSRQEMALMLVRAMEAMGIDTSKLIDSASIPDFNQVDSYYQDYVRVVYEKGLVGGMDAKGTFAPDFIMNRAQAAAVLTKLVALAE